MTGNGGARSRADQERAYALYLSGRGPLAARPGTSAHEFGLAMDINPWPSAREAALLAQFGAGAEQGDRQHHDHAYQGQAVVREFKKSFRHVTGEGPEAAGESGKACGRCHGSP